MSGPTTPRRARRMALLIAVMAVITLAATIAVVWQITRSDEPPAPNQTIHYEAVGANTTMLVEQLYDSGITLSSLHATLFALGIHEDTGSLTYPSTTYRVRRNKHPQLCHAILC